MIIVGLRGGLGNQLFQYAMAKRLANHLGVELKLDLEGLGNPNYRMPRHYELAPFQLSEGFASEREVAALTKFKGGLLARLARWKAPQSPASHIRERHYHFDPNMLNLPDDVYLDGYWQNERYFADASDMIREAFTIVAPPDAENAALAARIAGVNAVSLHVRRGDYITDPKVLAMHGTCAPEYYAAAVDHIAKSIDAPELFIFSDDPDWARSHLSFQFPTHVVTLNSADTCHEDLRLMSRCRHHVIANSTFSWWGAWLNPNMDKTVVAPKRWFAEDKWNVKNLIPDRWVCL